MIFAHLALCAAAIHFLPAPEIACFGSGVLRFAHRAFCGRLIRRRPAADIVRDVPLELLPSAESAPSIRWSLFTGPCSRLSFWTTPHRLHGTLYLEKVQPLLAQNVDLCHRAMNLGFALVRGAHPRGLPSASEALGGTGETGGVSHLIRKGTRHEQYAKQASIEPKFPTVEVSAWWEGSVNEWEH